MPLVQLQLILGNSLNICVVIVSQNYAPHFQMFARFQPMALTEGHKTQILVQETCTRNSEKAGGFFNLTSWGQHI